MQIKERPALRAQPAAFASLGRKNTRRYAPSLGMQVASCRPRERRRAEYAAAEPGGDWLQSRQDFTPQPIARESSILVRLVLAPGHTLTAERRSDRGAGYVQ